jgi:hypothetical protein
VVWSDFGFQNDYDDHVERRGLEDVGPFRFSWDSYASTLSTTIGMFGYDSTGEVLPDTRPSFVEWVRRNAP